MEQNMPSAASRCNSNEPTRDGDTEVHVLSNLPAEISPKTMANLYQQRWTVETAFGEIATTLRGEVETLAYPKAALFGFCTALTMYNLLRVVKAAIRAAHRIGNDKISAYHLADEIAATYRGMMIVLPRRPGESNLRNCQLRMAAALIRLAKLVRLSQFRKHPRGPEASTAQAIQQEHRSHISTKRILDQREVVS